jgi:TrpR-related protein YerC/YecD
MQSAMTAERAAIDDLCDALLTLKTRQEMLIFLKDLCTPQELNALTERWRVCQLLAQGDLSYRDIHAKTGASLTTIGRVARFLKEEPYHGYKLVLERKK